MCDAEGMNGDVTEL